MMIGGHARSEGLTDVTNNVREFRRMPGLRLEKLALVIIADLSEKRWITAALVDWELADS